MAALFAPEQAGVGTFAQFLKIFGFPPKKNKFYSDTRKIVLFVIMMTLVKWNKRNQISPPNLPQLQFFLIFFAQEVKKAIEKAKVKSSDVSVAAVNGPKMTVISGRKDVVGKACGGWQAMVTQVLIETKSRNYWYME